MPLFTIPRCLIMGEWIHWVFIADSSAWKMSKYGVYLVQIFLYSDWIQRFTEQISVVRPNTRKYGSGKTLYLDTIEAMFPLKELKNPKK